MVTWLILPTMNGLKTVQVSQRKEIYSLNCLPNNITNNNRKTGVNVVTLVIIFHTCFPSKPQV